MYFLAGWLIDGSGRPAEPRRLITVDDGRISAIDPCPEQDGPAPSRVIDLSHAVVLPPLIDSHVHLCMSGSIDRRIRELLAAADCARLRPVIDEHLRHQFSHGVLAVRDGGDPQGCLLSYCPDRVSGSGPVLVRRSGRAYYRENRYGSLIGGSPLTARSLADTYEHDRQPIDQVKVVNSGLNSLVAFGRQTPPQFTPAELAELVRRAHRDGRKVMVHANGRLPVHVAIEAGCDSVEHGYFMGEENLKLMATRGTFWVPTIYTMRAFAEHLEQYRGKADRQVVVKTLAAQVEQLAAARRHGVRVALGTDAGSAGVLHGEAVSEEMDLFLQAGYSIEETIRCATEHSARLLGLDDEWGRIACGRPAHFLVAGGTPAHLPRSLLFLEAIYLSGRPVGKR